MNNNTTPSFTYYTTSPKYTSPTAVSSYFYKELELKNKQISELQARINILFKDKQNLQSQINELKSKNYNLSFMTEQESKQSLLQNQQKELQYQSQIQKLMKENNELKQRINKEENTEMNYQNTFTFKLSNAQKEIDNLSVMNTFKDNILYHMQEFYNRLNNLIGVKFQYELDFCNDDLNTYMSRLKEIESKVMNQLQFDDGNVMKNNNNVSMYDNVNTNENGNKVNTSKTVKTTITNKKRSNSKQYRETAGNSVNNTNMNVNTNSSNNNNNSKLSKYDSLLRTPPRDDDYIAPLSGQMDYLKSINEYNTRSRSNYNF
jgi:hypothetical protein